METTGNALSSMVQTRSIERVLAPIAAQVSQLIILNENANKDGSKLPNLVPFAQQVLRATEDLVSVGQKLTSQSSDEELCRDMPEACEKMKSTGRNVLMAVQRLQAEPHSEEAKENMVLAAQRLLQATLKVLLVSDGAEVRRIIQAANIVRDRLRLVQSVGSMKALVVSFKALADSVTVLSGLCDRRQQDLTQPQTKERVRVAMETLRRSVPTLSSAMQTYVKYRDNAQAMASRDYVISQVSSVVADIIGLMGNQLQGEAGLADESDREEYRETPGHFVQKLDRMIEFLSPNHRACLDAEFYGCLEDVIRQSMTTSSLSRDKLREQIVTSCKQILKQRGLIKGQNQAILDNPDFQQLRADFEAGCESLAKELLVLEKLVKFAVIGQTVDAFVQTAEPLDRMVKASTAILKEKGPLREKDCVRILQPLEETFHEHNDRMCQLGTFAAASCPDNRKAEVILDAVGQLERLDPEVFPACLAVRQDILNKGAVRHLKLLRREWQSEVQRLVNAIDDLIDANRFLELSESYIQDDLEECQQAEVIADRDLLAQAASNLLGRTKRVIQVAYNQLEAAEDPIFRNGLRVHITQLEKAMNLVKIGAQKALSSFGHKRAHLQLSERGHHLLECLHKVGQAVLGREHPDLLDPLRKGLASKAGSKAEDFPDYGMGDASPTPLSPSPAPPPARLQFSNESYLSKPLPPSAGLLVSDPDSQLTSSLSHLHLTKQPTVSQKTGSPVRLSYPMSGLVRALFSRDPDPKKVDMLCVEAENKSVFLASLAARASDCSQDLQLKGRLESQVLRLVSKTSELVEQARVALMSDEAAKAEANLLAEAWTSLVADLCLSLEEVIGCWGLPGSKLREAALRGGREALLKEIDSLSFHTQSVHRLVRVATEASQATSRLSRSEAADSSTQIQLLEKEASDWTRLSQSLVSAANETVADIDNPLLVDLIGRRWLDWSVRQLQLIAAVDRCALQMPGAVAVATAAGRKVADSVQQLKEFAGKMARLADGLVSSGDLPAEDGVQKARQCLEVITRQLTEALLARSRRAADLAQLTLSSDSQQQVALLQREWAATAQLLATGIDELTGGMATPLDRLGGAALAVSHALGPSRQELLDEFQTQSDGLCAAVSGTRLACARALKPAPAGPQKARVLAAVDDLCRLTPIAVTQARSIADKRPVAMEDVAFVKRQWACNAKALITGLQDNPHVMSSTVKGVTTALRCQGQFQQEPVQTLRDTTLEEQAAPLDTSSLSSHQLDLLQTLPRQGMPAAFNPRNHSTPSDEGRGRPSLRPPPATSPSRTPQWQASLRASLSRRASASPGELDESDGPRKGSSLKSRSLKEEGTKSPYRTRALGMQDFPRLPGLRSATSTPTLRAPLTSVGMDALNQSTYSKCSTSIAAAAHVLQQEAEKWEDESNSIVKVAKTISAQMYDMARYARKINNPAAKEEMTNTAKAIAANGKVIYRFAEILAEHCLDKRVGGDLKFCAENIPALCTQLSIVASVKAATPDDDTTDIVLMKNADNLMQAVLSTLKAAESACVKGLHPVSDGSKDEEEARALAMQWRLRLDQHRHLQASCCEVDALGLRKLSRNASAPALSQILTQR